MPRNIGPSLDALKQWQRDEITRRRDREKYKPVTYNGVVYDADADARENISDTATAIANGRETGPIYWRDAADVTQTLTTTEFLDMATVALGAYKAVYMHSFNLKDAITFASDAASVRAITWDSTP